MADFVAVLRKTLEGLKDPSDEVRQRVYAKARETIRSKLSGMNPKPPQPVIERQMQSLEEAISEVEASFALTDFDLGSEEIGDLLLEDIDTAPRGESASLDLPDPVVRPDSMPRSGPAAAPATAVRPAPSFKPDPVLDRIAASAAEARGAHRRESDFDDDLDDDADLVGLDDAPPPPLGRGKAAGNDWDDEDDDFAPPRRKARAGVKRRLVPAVLSLLALLVVAGGAYAVWQYRDTLLEFAGSSGSVEEVIEEDVAEEEPEAAQQVAAAAPEADGPEKFTQRLLADGSEVDAGPAGDEPRIGEGTSVAAASTGEQVPAEQAAAVAVGQKAIFYEERTNSQQGSAEPGEVVWSLVQESPGRGLPPEPAIRAEASIPAKNLQFRMTIRRNGDESLPASHIIEMIFLIPDDFEGGAIDNILRVAFKDSEQAPGSPLLGLPAKITDGFFLLALSDTKAELDANTMMMRRLDWLDIPIVYRSGRRALITLEKGIPGTRVFEEALTAWSSESSG